MLSDLRFAFRQLTKSPGFSLTIIATLALAISACTVVFSIVNTIVLNPLPNPEPEQLVTLRARQTATASQATSISALEFLDWKSRAQSFAGLYAWRAQSVNLTGLPEPLRITAR